jgi:hypothetical protein
MRLALEILTLVLGGCVMVVILPPAPKRQHASRRPESIRRPSDLEQLERLTVTGRATAAEVHLRLRPVLREIALTRLGQRGVQLDRSPDSARDLLGDKLWELVRQDRPRPDDLRAPGMSLEELEAIVERLERL